MLQFGELLLGPACLGRCTAADSELVTYGFRLRRWETD